MPSIAPHQGRTGLALLLTAGILAILGSLVAAFLTLCRLERRASLQRVHVSRALLLARSGLEDALARVCAGQEASYGGEDWNADGLLGGTEAASEVHRPGLLDTAACPVRHALRPSFFARSGSAPALLPVDSRERGCSGRLAPTAVFALKVEDESSKINVNGGLLDLLDRDLDAVPDHRDPDPGVGWNAQLLRILDILGQDPDIGIPGLGALVVAARPPGGYPDWAAFRSVTGIQQDLSTWLTLGSWSDPSVVRPNAAHQTGYAQTFAELKQCRGPLELEAGGRPPVNLNAAPRPVLLALTEGLRGLSFASPGIPAPFDFGPLEQPGLASAVADRILASRPFGTWADFHAFCDGLVPGTIGNHFLAFDPGHYGGADLLKANFDPNTALNKQFPDQLNWRWVDKSDLTLWSTEGCLKPTGTFRVASVGRVLDPEGRLLAEAVLQGRVEAYRPLRHTSQADFVAGRTFLADYLSPSVGAAPTTGASAGPGWWGGPPPGQGLSLISHPNPPPALVAPGCLAAKHDGSLTLATVETPMEPTIRFLHRFDDGWDADGGVNLARQDGPNDDLLQTDLKVPSWPASGPAGTLGPDGAQLQLGRCPAFDADVLPALGRRGVISYWVKPLTASWDAVDSMDIVCVRGSGSDTQYLGFGRGEDSQDRWGLIMENDFSTADPEYERQRRIHQHEPLWCHLPGLRWHLVTGLWDIDCPNTVEDVRLSLRDAVLLANGDAGAPEPAYPDPYNLVNSKNLVAPGVLLHVGGNGEFHNQAHAVLDELAVCDFGADPGIAWAAAEAWSSLRFQDGRYDKLGGRFLSSELAANETGRLLRADWTVHLPKDRRMDLRRVSFLSGLGVEPVGMPRVEDPVLADDPVTMRPRVGVSLELMDAGAGIGGYALRPLVNGGRLDEAMKGFRYRIRFWTDLEHSDDPVLESPVLEDVTFAWQGRDGPRFVEWER